MAIISMLELLSPTQPYLIPAAYYIKSTKVVLRTLHALRNIPSLERQQVVVSIINASATQLYVEFTLVLALFLPFPTAMLLALSGAKMIHY